MCAIVHPPNATRKSGPVTGRQISRNGKFGWTHTSVNTFLAQTGRNRIRLQGLGPLRTQFDFLSSLSNVCLSHSYNEFCRRGRVEASRSCLSPYSPFRTACWISQPRVQRSCADSHRIACRFVLPGSLTCEELGNRSRAASTSSSRVSRRKDRWRLELR